MNLNISNRYPSKQTISGLRLQQRGATLAEVLVSMLLLGIALTSLIALHAKAISTTQSAIWHNQAAILAKDFAARIRLNPFGWSINLISPSTTVNSNIDHMPVCLKEGACQTPQALAQLDQREMAFRSAHSLPNGHIQLGLCSSGYPRCITVTWGEWLPADCIAHGLEFNAYLDSTSGSTTRDCLILEF